MESIGTSSQNIQIGGNGIIVLHCSKIISNTQTHIIRSVSESGYLNIYNCEFTNSDSNLITMATLAGCDISFYSCKFTSNTLNSILTISNIAVVCLYNCIIINNGNTANSHGIEKSAGSLVLSNISIFTTHLSSYSIYAPSSQDILVYFCVANKSKHANVTEKVSTIIVDPLVI